MFAMRLSTCQAGVMTTVLRASRFFDFFQLDSKGAETKGAREPVGDPFKSVPKTSVLPMVT